MPSLASSCRSLSGIVTLPYFTTFVAGVFSTFKQQNACGCYFDSGVNYISSFTARQSPENATISGSAPDSSHPAITVNWTINFSATDLGNGFMRITVTGFVVTNSSGGSGPIGSFQLLCSIPGSNTGWTTIGGFLDIPYMAQMRLISLSVVTSSGQSDANINFQTVVQGYWRWLNPLLYVDDVFYPNFTSTGTPGGATLRDEMQGQAGYDVPADCTSTYCGPPVWATGLAPFRVVEEGTVASGLVIGTTYHVRWTWEYRAIGSAGSWTAAPSTRVINFKASQATERLPWVGLPTGNIQSSLGGTFLNEFRLKSVVFF